MKDGCIEQNTNTSSTYFHAHCSIQLPSTLYQQNYLTTIDCLLTLTLKTSVCEGQTSGRWYRAALAKMSIDPKCIERAQLTFRRHIFLKNYADLIAHRINYYSSYFTVRFALFIAACCSLIVAAEGTHATMGMP